ncbi:hypothetical protein LDENG_00080820 [Lucifuga dentata]|nr:hypothetical protein LDENG_00080820 [Lucifuga dentata]
MINTYHTSVAPPPIPPRLNRSSTVLIPAPAPSYGYSKSLIQVLVAVVLLQFLLSCGGFAYLYHIVRMETIPSAGGKVAPQISEEPSHRPMARTIIKPQPPTPTSGYLQWNIEHSFFREIYYYNNTWLTVLQPGDYYVYSRVTFSKGDPKTLLASRVRLRKNEFAKEKDVMKAYCNLDSSANPHMCTASQGEVITLEKGNQLSVWVTNFSLVDYEVGATTFGMYNL